MWSANVLFIECILNKSIGYVGSDNEGMSDTCRQGIPETTRAAAFVCARVRLHLPAGPSCPSLGAASPKFRSPTAGRPTRRCCAHLPVLMTTLWSDTQTELNHTQTHKSVEHGLCKKMDHRELLIMKPKRLHHPLEPGCSFNTINWWKVKLVVTSHYTSFCNLHK